MMITKSSASTLLLFFFLFSTKSCFIGVANTEPVLDIDGEEVRPDVEYYVVSAITGAGGGGLALGSDLLNQCPRFVAQQRSDLNNGLPVKFWPVDTNSSVVQLSTDLNIRFIPAIDAYCRASTVWKLEDYDPSTGKWWVTTDGTIGEPGASTLMNWFKIEKLSERIYKFLFCPSVCDSCITLCSDVGRGVSPGGNMRLALDPQGWLFVLIKVSRVIKQVA